jgi:hypothetical protein
MAPRGTDLVVVPVEASDFPLASSLNGSHILQVRWDDLLWASITVGKSRRDVLRHGQYSFAEILHRVSCLYAYYDVGSTARLVLSPAFRSLDYTEKGLVSFYTGMAMAKLYADKVLGIPWMMHISRYETPWAVRFGANTNRPDLFGCNPLGEWAVAEAKGRARVTAKLVSKMKQQKSAVATIQRVPPTFRYGAATRFEGGELALRVVDPPGRRRAEDIPLDPAAWLVDYYRPIVDLLETAATRTEGEAIIGQLPGTDIEVGVSRGIADLVRESRDRPLLRPGPRPAHIQEFAHVPPSLVEQTQGEGERLMVERVTNAVRDVVQLEGSTSDGVIVRSPRR